MHSVKKARIFAHKLSEHMKRFFNIIGNEGNGRILLYGDIGPYNQIDAGQIARELAEAESIYKKIDVYINSYGGDVFSGITIFNEFQASKADITIYVVGVAASIASGIATCGKPVFAAPNAYFMIHGVSGGCYGKKEEIEIYLAQMEKLEETLCQMYSAKMNITPDEVKARFFDGTDHWLTAQEAQELGLIDGIMEIDTEPVPDASTPEKVYQHYQNKYNQSLKESNMFEQLKKRPSFANCADDAQVLQKIDELEQNAAKVPGLETEKANLETEKATLQTEVDEYKRKEREAQEAALDQEVEDAFGQGRITDQERPEFKNLMRANPESCRKIIQGRPAKKRALDNLYTPGGGGGTSKGAWEEEQERIRNNTNQKL